MLVAASPITARRLKKKSGKYKTYRYKLGNRFVEVQGYEREALEYLVREKNICPTQIKCECEFGTMLNIRYKYRNKMRDYIPDFYIPHLKLVVEVKSHHTLGLLSNTKRGWSMNCAKALASHHCGFKFMLLLMDKSGRRYRMPKNWAKMKKQECVEHVKQLNPTKDSERVALLEM